MPSQRFSRDEEARYYDPSPAIRFAIRQAAKQFHTAMPGVVVSYDSDTRRAVIQPALSLLFHDGRTQKRPPLHDVPVAQLWGNGLGVHLPVAPGDLVMMVFSMRGITEFKRDPDSASSDPGNTTPDQGAILSAADAIAFPYGPTEITPAGEGACIQSEDGDISVRVNTGEGVFLKAGDTEMEVKSSGVKITGTLEITSDLTVRGGSISHGDIEVGKDHEHSILTTEVLKVAGPRIPAPVPPIISITTQDLDPP